MHSLSPPASRTRRTRHRPHCGRLARGLSLVELLVFITVVSLALAGVLQVFVQATTRSADPAQMRQALALAQSLLEEVQLMPFTWCDGDDAAVATASSAAGCTGAAEALGPEPGEGRYASPSFDHVNDYHGFTLSAGIVDVTNTAVPGLAGFGARVSVAPVALHTITSASGAALRVAVTVTTPDGRELTLEGHRTRHAPNSSF